MDNMDDRLAELKANLINMVNMAINSFSCLPVQPEPITVALMANGVWCMAYMDNLIIMAPSQTDALLQWMMVLETISGLGWHINYKKSLLELSQPKEFLGLTINTLAEPCFHVLAAKVHMLKHNIDLLLCVHTQTGSVPVHQVVAVVGHCCSLMHAILLAQLLLCNLYHNIKHQQDWTSMIQLSPAAINDLHKWKIGLSKWDGWVVTMRPFNVVLDTNASLTGWGTALKDLKLAVI